MGLRAWTRPSVDFTPERTLVGRDPAKHRPPAAKGRKLVPRIKRNAIKSHDACRITGRTPAPAALSSSHAASPSGENLGEDFGVTAKGTVQKEDNFRSKPYFFRGRKRS